MERIAFDQWWVEFGHESRGDKSGGFDPIRKLARYVARLTPAERTVFVAELQALVERRGEDWQLVREYLTNPLWSSLDGDVRTEPA
jgi:hypothetical protein